MKLIRPQVALIMKSLHFCVQTDLQMVDDDHVMSSDHGNWWPCSHGHHWNHEINNTHEDYAHNRNFSMLLHSRIKWRGFKYTFLKTLYLYLCLTSGSPSKSLALSCSNTALNLLYVVMSTEKAQITDFTEAQKRSFNYSCAKNKQQWRDKSCFN